MAKVKIYTHIKEDVENGEVVCVDVYIDPKTHKLFLPSVVSNYWLEEKKAINLIFGDRKPSEEELQNWKQEKIKEYNDRIDRNVIEISDNQDQAYLENLWK